MNAGTSPSAVLSHNQYTATYWAVNGASVFPCVGFGPKAKAPLIQGGFKNATTDPATVDQWWGKSPTGDGAQFPGAAVGLALPEGLMVIDCDVDLSKGSDGLAELRAVLGEAEFLVLWRSTVKVRTPSGGWHLYVRPDNLSTFSNGTNVGGLQGVDLRVSGKGYVIAPLTQMGDGGRYEFVDDARNAITAPSAVAALVQRIASGNLPGLGGAVTAALAKKSGASATTNAPTPVDASAPGLAHLMNSKALAGVQRLNTGLSTPVSVPLDALRSALEHLIAAMPEAERSGRDAWRDNVLFPLSHGSNAGWWTEAEGKALFEDISSRWGGDTSGNDGQWDAAIAKGVPAIGSNPKTARSALKLARSHGRTGHIPPDPVGAVSGSGAASGAAGSALSLSGGSGGGNGSRYALVMGEMAKNGYKFMRDAWALDKVLVVGPGGGAPKLCDEPMLRKFRNDIFDMTERDPEDKAVYDVVLRLADQNSYDDVAEMLQRAKAAWDGTYRLGWMASTYFDVSYEDQAELDYANEAVFRTLIGLVLRARQPGCKFDTMLVLEGREGCGKSTAVSVLLEGVGLAHRYSETRVLGLRGEQQEIEALSGALIVEASELDGLNRSGVERFKALLSRRTDKARMAYGKQVTEAPRRCGFIGTTNAGDYLRGTTGNRRVLPIEVGKIDVAGIKRDALQLWGEAVLYVEHGFGPVLSPASQKVARAMQQDSVQESRWTGLVADAVTASLGKTVAPRRMAEQHFITLNDVAKVLDRNQLGKLPRDIDTIIVHELRRLGWKSFRRRLNGERLRGYIKPFDPADMAVDDGATGATAGGARSS